jgi:hypothetical protein
MVASYKLASARPATATLMDSSIYTQRRRVGRSTGTGAG